MPQPTTSQVYIDQILQNYSRLFMNQVVDFVAERSFPVMPVDQPSGEYFLYSKSFWFTDEMEVRSGGNRFPVSGYEIETASYVTTEYALAYRIPDETASAMQSPLQADQDAVEWLQTKRLIHMENSFATNYMKTGVWNTDNTTATDWDNVSSGVPITNMQVALETIKKDTGQTADTLVMGKIVRNGLVLNNQITDKIKHTSRALPGDIDAALPAALDVRQLLVSNATYETAAEGVTSNMAKIIDDDALVILSPERVGPRTATAGITLSWEGGGGMGSFFRIRDDLAHADEAQIMAQWTQELVSAELGYFFSDVV